jgi:hypothetical protein
MDWNRIKSDAKEGGARKRVAILQSNYIPWKGYFDIIASVDEFIVYDCVQFTKNDWRNRNQVKTAQGKIWLTVPVNQRTLHQAIDETEVADLRCFRKHWTTFRQSYARAPYIRHCSEALEHLFANGPASNNLSECNLHFLRGICHELAIGTRIRSASEFDLKGDRSERLVDLCTQARATAYLSGPAARSYLDEAPFARAGIAVEWMKYEYAEYPQPHPPFDHYVSVLDLIACTGRQAREHLTHSRTMAS